MKIFDGFLSCIAQGMKSFVDPKTEEMLIIIQIGLMFT
jgi:hypothetical protein